MCCSLIVLLFIGVVVSIGFHQFTHTNEKTDGEADCSAEPHEEAYQEIGGCTCDPFEQNCKKYFYSDGDVTLKVYIGIGDCKAEKNDVFSVVLPEDPCLFDGESYEKDNTTFQSNSFTEVPWISYFYEESEVGEDDIVVSVYDNKNCHVGDGEITAISIMRDQAAMYPTYMLMFTGEDIECKNAKCINYEMDGDFSHLWDCGRQPWSNFDSTLFAILFGTLVPGCCICCCCLCLLLLVLVAAVVIVVVVVVIVIAVVLVVLVLVVGVVGGGGLMGGGGLILFKKKSNKVVPVVKKEYKPQEDDEGEEDDNDKEKFAEDT